MTGGDPAYGPDMRAALAARSRCGVNDPPAGSPAAARRKSTDLGRLVVSRANFSVDFGRSALVTSNADLIQRFTPDYAKMFGADAVSGWTAPRSPKDKVEEFARAHPAGAECVTELPDGRVVAASRMGAILVRSRPGPAPVPAGAGASGASGW